jgi:hypothetical protein
MATPTPSQTGWLDENAPVLALWGASELFAFIGLLLTIATLGIAIWGIRVAIRSLRATEESARGAAESAQKLLENELRATLDIAPNPHVYPPPQGDGLNAGGILDLTEGGPHVYMSGFVRNIGRFVARDIELTPFLGQKEGRVMNRPQQVLPPDAVPEQFDFYLPISLKDPTDPNSSLDALFASGEQTRLVFTFKDGNPTAEPYEVCFTFSPGSEPGVWVSKKVPCMGDSTRR